MPLIQGCEAAQRRVILDRLSCGIPSLQQKFDPPESNLTRLCKDDIRGVLKYLPHVILKKHFPVASCHIRTLLAHASSNYRMAPSFLETVINEKSKSHIT